MTQFAHTLNTTSDVKLTNGVWDDNVAQWMTKNQMYVQTAAGVWVALALDANGRLQASVKDSALPIGAATQATLASLLTRADITSSALRDALRGTSNKTITDLATALASVATTSKQDTLAGKIDTMDAVIDNILTQLGTTGLKKIIDPLPEGSNNIGSVTVSGSKAIYKESIVATVFDYSTAKMCGENVKNITSGDFIPWNIAPYGNKVIIVENDADTAINVQLCYFASSLTSTVIVSDRIIYSGVRVSIAASASKTFCVTSDADISYPFVGLGVQLERSGVGSGNVTVRVLLGVM